ncbi:hypothetical protein Salat_2604500 [Sesamum alatum]|uniref:DUF4216 domain-containing protein n=1 Tax=Sesamum alatum TaxID=300844 RepID=A0AAE1XN82_9LAMI|nr:hypothetical protein Salat_2604500 [Sesamum alatum]
MQVDKHFTSIDIRTRWYKNDPFVLPIQVQQVFYIADTKLGKNWQLVQRIQHRHLWDLPELDVEDDYDDTQAHVMNPLQQFQSNGVSQVVEGSEYMSSTLAREALKPEVLDENTYNGIRQREFMLMNSIAQSTHENMVAMQSELIDGNEDQPSEDVIMRSALGHRSGYVKGMGHGVEVVKNRQSCPSVVGNAELKEKLLELDRVNDKILNLTEAYEEQRMTLEGTEEGDGCL